MTRKEFFETYDRAKAILEKMQFTDSSSFAIILADELGLKEPKTEIVYEWYFKAEHGLWYLCTTLRTEEQAAKYFRNDTYKKTGRSFVVPCE